MTGNLIHGVTPSPRRYAGAGLSLMFAVKG
jgi:hypothetical protein